MRVLGIALVVVGLAACAGHTPFPDGAMADYQIGGAYPPRDGVGIVIRDRTAASVSGVFNICYLNAFQAQPDEIDWWRSTHPDLLLLDSAGNEVVDADWGEALVDISIDAKRTQLADIVGGWMNDCAAAGYQAVELDNLDSFTRSGDLLSRDDTVAYARLLTEAAHREGLLVAQKNTAELAPQGSEIGFDFAITERCEEYGECHEYTATYGRSVIEIEYDQAAFAAACQARGDRISVLLRDLDVVPEGHPGYLYRAC